MKFLVLPLLALIILLPSCGRSDAGRTAKMAEDTDRFASPGAADLDEAKEGGIQRAKGKSSGGELDSPFFSLSNLAGERWLEYNVSLRYRSEDFRKARRELIRIAGIRGFVMNEGADASGEQPYLSATLHVRSGELYPALLDCDALGKLLSERIEALDHTEKMEISRRKVEREEARMARRSKALSGLPAADSNWSSREAALERSEDAADAASHGQWQVRDAVAWAKVSITIEGPQGSGWVRVPDFLAALVILANFSLSALWWLLLLSPILAALVVIWLRRQSILGLLRKRKEGP